MVAGDAKGTPDGHHAHGDARGLHDVRTTVHEISHEDGPAAGRVAEGMPWRRPAVSETAEKADQLVGTAVHVADDVERSGVRPDAVRTGG